MNGQISEQPLVEVVREIHVKRHSGALRVRRDTLHATVYFRGGGVVFALSNLRSFRLDNFLLGLHLLSERQLTQAQERCRSEAEFGEKLLASHLIDREGLSRVFEARTREITRSALLTTRGEWTFETGLTPAQNAHAALDLPQLLLEAARKKPLPTIEQRLADEREKFTVAKGAAALKLDLLPVEAFVLSRADVPVSVGELSALTGAPEDETRRVAYALALAGMLARESWPPTLGATPKPIVLQKVEKRVAQPEQVKPAVRHQPETGAPADAETTERVRMEELFARADGADDHEILGLSPDANAQQIKMAYYDLARKYHPDRFRLTRDAALRSRIEMSFARIKKSYDILKKENVVRPSAPDGSTTPDQNNGATPAGEAQTEAPPPAPPVVSTGTEQMAEERFQQGELEARRGNELLAMTRFSEAAQLAPKQARYRARYGSLLSRNPQMRRLAETELQAAISLDERNVDYHVMLAELYREMGLKRRAEAQLKQALGLDARRADVRQKLEALQVN